MAAVASRARAAPRVRRPTAPARPRASAAPRARASSRRAGAHGFASKAQWRFFFAKAHRDPRFAKWAREKAHATAGGPKVRFRRLPARKRAPSVRTVR